MKNKPKREELKRMLLESIDETLNILGESTKKTVLYFLKQNYQIEEKEILDSPEAFISGIREIFGEVGSTFLESRIIEALYRKMGLIAPSTLSFEDAIKNARKLYLEI